MSDLIKSNKSQTESYIDYEAVNSITKFVTSVYATHRDLKMALDDLPGVGDLFHFPIV